MIVTACLLDAEPPRLAHPMADHRLMQLPVLGRAACRIGAVDGRRPVCEELLRAGATVLTFPEGMDALEKRWADRYRLRPFRHGFMHVAMATRAPVVPVAVIGAEEEAPLIANPRWLARLLGTPSAPVTATVVVPLPVKYRIHFGRPMRFGGRISPAAVTHNVGAVRASLDELIQRGLAAREHVFF
jgi:1-acyl-sn-glycerol-3-phosphate acyltransferase